MKQNFQVTVLVHNLSENLILYLYLKQIWGLSSDKVSAKSDEKDTMYNI